MYINDENKVIIQGPIAAINAGNFVTNITVKVKKWHLPNYGKSLSEDTPLYNWITFSINDAFVKEEAKGFEIGDEIKAEGEIKVKQKVSKLTNSVFYDQWVEVNKIEKAQSIYKKELGADIKGCEQFALFKLTGEITKIIVFNGTVSINISTIIGRDVNNIQTFIYTKEPEKITECFKEKDIVNVIGNIQVTRKNITEDATINRKNFIIEQIEKIDSDKDLII